MSVVAPPTASRTLATRSRSSSGSALPTFSFSAVKPSRSTASRDSATISSRSRLSHPTWVLYMRTRSWAPPSRMYRGTFARRAARSQSATSIAASAVDATHPGVSAWMLLRRRSMICATFRLFTPISWSSSSSRRSETIAVPPVPMVYPKPMPRRPERSVRSTIGSSSASNFWMASPRGGSTGRRTNRASAATSVASSIITGLALSAPSDRGPCPETASARCDRDWAVLSRATPRTSLPARR